MTQLIKHWMEYIPNESESYQILLQVPREHYYCVQRSYPLAIGRDIQKVVITAGRDLTPYPGGLVNFWIEKTMTEFKVTYWCFKSDVSALIRNSNAVIVLPTTFEHDIVDGPSSLDEAIDTKIFAKKVFRRVILSPAWAYAGLVNTEAISRIIKPFNRYFFAKALAWFSGLSIGYLLLVSTYLAGLELFVSDKREDSRLLVSEYFNLKKHVEQKSRLLAMQTELVDMHVGHSMLFSRLQAIQNKHALIINSFRFDKGKVDMTLEANNANSLVQELMQVEGFIGLELVGVVNKAHGKDKFRLQFKWSYPLWA
ncbi:MAG: hypothetical protein HWE10_07265 [Gammaproteobacteria bacterium]|nr:hypothetical protein [Gammaproteobacteria bacterium]